MLIECTEDCPWNGVKQPDDHVRHTNVIEVGDQEDGYPGGDIVTYECRNCGTRWKSELPQ